MTEEPFPNLALLPAGLRDVLPPEAETEASSVEGLMEVFAGHGYQRVKPPLMEYEDSLLAGAGAAVADQTFRLMDPQTHRMVGLRTDMTPQLVRIASTRLAHAPRPLRLCYAGQTLRARPNGMAPDRQVAQAGIELIGHDSPEADAEMVVVAAEALARLGLARVIFDLTMPALVQSLVDDAGLRPAGRTALAHALDRKDAAAVAEHGGAAAATMIDLLLAAGPASGALAALSGASLPPAARAHADRLADAVATIQAWAPGAKLTVDAVEFRGYRYHTGVCTTVYAPGRHEELGRGGRYLSGEDEPATGITLYPDALLRPAPPRAPRRRVYLPAGHDRDAAAALRGQGYATVAGLAQSGDDARAARVLHCAYLLSGATLTPLVPE